MCYKKKFDRIKAMMILASNSQMYKIGKRQEIRMYWCYQCHSYHLTSKLKLKK